VTIDVDTGVVLRAQGITKRFDDTWALRDCTFELPPGRVTALVGANGAGKTTLLTVLSGLLAPDAGTVERNGKVAFMWRSLLGYWCSRTSKCLKEHRRGVDVAREHSVDPHQGDNAT
jgi:ABC-type multidrug transport system ATPase subunit